jgi:hypothetical protein
LPGPECRLHQSLGTRLIFQKEVIFEKGKIRRDGEVSLAEVGKDYDLENGVGIQMGKFNFEVMKESAEENASWEPKASLGKGLGYHYFSGIWGGNLLALYRLPLENGVRGEEMVCYQLEDLLLVDGGGFEHLWT